MEYQIELFRGADLKFAGTESLMSVVRESVGRLLGMSMTDTSIKIQIQNIPEDFFDSSNGTPIVENAVPEFGYLIIQVYKQQHLIYQHPHALQDIITHTLQMRLKNKFPEELYWQFRIDVPGMPLESAIRRAPKVEGSFHIHSGGPGEKSRLSIRRLEDDILPMGRIRDFGISRIPDQDKETTLKVLVPAALEKELCYTRSFSPLVEEGGFLIGKVYQDEDVENGQILELTNAITAQYTGASFLHFTFTGDSFVEVKRTLRLSQSGERMLGWYHTHLFPATPEFGLSSIDLRLHFSTFTIPWQLAGLINLDRHGRTLRFYASKNNTMVLVPHYII